MTEKHWTRRAAEAIDADIDAACNYPPARPDRLMRIARIVAIIDKHRPPDIPYAEMDDAMRRLEALEQEIKAAVRQVKAVEAVKRPVYPHGV